MLRLRIFRKSTFCPSVALLGITTFAIVGVGCSGRIENEVADINDSGAQAELDAGVVDATPDAALVGANVDSSGPTFVPSDVTGTNEIRVAGEDQYAQLTIDISDAPGFCGRLAHKESRRNESVLSLSVTSVLLKNPSSIAPGSFSVGAPDSRPSAAGFIATANFAKTDGQCRQTLLDGGADAGWAIAGTLVIESITDSVITGSFNLAFQFGTMAGPFVAGFCRLNLDSDAGPGQCD